MRMVILSFMLLVGWSTSAMANTVAVIDIRNAVMQSKAAKSELAKLKRSIASDQKRLEALQREMSTLEASFQSKRQSLNDADKKKMQQQAQTKLAEYNRLGASIQKRMEDSQSKLLSSLMPKMRAGIEQVRKSKNIDVVIDKQYVQYVSTEWDITPQVTQYIDTH